MARYVGPKCRLCRREGVQLFLKGSRCESPKCAVVRRQQPPGQHGASRQRQASDYGRQLREKQKAKRIYGVMERQFRGYFEEAAKHGGEAGEHLLQLLERRLDNVLYRLGYAHSRSHARQLVRQGKITLNGVMVNIPSIRVKMGDELGFSDETLAQARAMKEIVPWLLLPGTKGKVSVVKEPERNDIKEPIEEQLIVEYYSR